MVDLKSLEAELNKNDVEMEVARRLGITDEKVLADHPELVKAREMLADSGVGAAKKAAITAGVAGLGLASFPIFFIDVMKKSRTLSVAVGLATAIGASLTAGITYISAAMAFKGKKNLEVELRKENEALKDEILRTKDGAKVLAQVQAEADAGMLPSKVVLDFGPVEGTEKSHTSNVTPRDPSHTQAVKDEPQQTENTIVH
jgi:hypothetical protein